MDLGSLCRQGEVDFLENGNSVLQEETICSVGFQAEENKSRSSRVGQCGSVFCAQETLAFFAGTEGACLNKFFFVLH